MQRPWIMAGIVGCFFVAGAVPIVAQGDKPPTAKEIMTKLNKGPNSLCPTVGKGLKAEAPSWEEILKESKEFTALATALEKAKPPKRDDADWAKQTKGYAADAKALEDAAAKKDKPAAQAAHAKLANQKTCMACHSAHR